VEVRDFWDSREILTFIQEFHELMLIALKIPSKNIGYAQYFNRRHRRNDQLFQNRYKSFLCEEDIYLLVITAIVPFQDHRNEATS